MFRALFIGAAVLAGCGRFNFDPGVGDSGVDAPTPEMTCANAVSATTFDAIGAGTTGDPYVLCNADQLTDMMTNGRVSASYAVGGPIDMAGRTVMPFATIETPFSGDFHGGGHAISNLSLDHPSTDELGMFSAVSGTVHDVTLVNVFVHGNKHVGGLVGWMWPEASIARCSTTGTVQADNDYAGGVVAVIGAEFNGRSEGAIVAASFSTADVSAAGYAGGLVGVAIGETLVIDSYATGSVRGGGYIGGLVGGQTGTVANSFATGDVTGGDAVGGFVGGDGGRIVDSYSTGDVSSTTSDVTRIGRFVGEHFSTVDSINVFFLSTSTCTGPSGCHGVLTGETAVPASHFTSVTNQPLAEWNPAQWTVDAAGPHLIPRLPDTTWTSCVDHMNDAPYAGGDGTLAFPIHICTATQFAKIAARQSDWGHYYAFQLDANIDEADEQQGQPIGSVTTPFRAIFDGRGHTIANLGINLPAIDYCGVFGMFAGRLRRLGVVNANVKCMSHVGAIAGSANGAYVRDVFATGVVTNGGFELGGAFGNLRSGQIDRGYFVGTLNGLNAGGFVGRDFAFGGYGDGVRSSFASAVISSGDDTGQFATTDVDISNAYDMNAACSGCNVMQAARPKSRAALFDPVLEPLSAWDFTTVWQENPGDAPTLRPL